MIFKYLEWTRLVWQMKHYQKVDDYKGQTRPGHLYRFFPEGAVCSDGSPYHALFRTGTENRLLIVLDGGGVMFDRFSAARPSAEVYVPGSLTFYDSYCKPSKNAYARLSIFHEKCRKSPFYGWNLLYVPYASGDFHTGAGEFTYEDTEGKERVFYAHGNINLHKSIDFMKQFCSDPEQLVVLGCSAGGFGTAAVGNDILECFPDCRDCTCLVDGAAFDLDYMDCARELWQTPASIAAEFRTNNIVADGIEYLYEQQKDRVKIGYVISVRDFALSMYQCFIDGRKEMALTREGTERIHQIISDTVKRLEQSVPGFSYFLYDYNFNDIKGRPMAGSGADSHCCLWVPEFVRFEREGCTGLRWIGNVMAGKTTKIGKDLIL